MSGDLGADAGRRRPCGAPPAVLELVGSLALLLDAFDWDALERLFTDPVQLERASSSAARPSAPPSSSTAIAKRSATSTPTCHVITLDGDEATCAANMQGTHVLVNASGGPIWTVGGRHDYQLNRSAAGASAWIAGLPAGFIPLSVWRNRRGFVLQRFARRGDLMSELQFENVDDGEEAGDRDRRSPGSDDAPSP